MKADLSPPSDPSSFSTAL